MAANGVALGHDVFVGAVHHPTDLFRTGSCQGQLHRRDRAHVKAAHNRILPTCQRHARARCVQGGCRSEVKQLQPADCIGGRRFDHDFIFTGNHAPAVIRSGHGIRPGTGAAGVTDLAQAPPDVFRAGVVHHGAGAKALVEWHLDTVGLSLPRRCQNASQDGANRADGRRDAGAGVGRELQRQCIAGGASARGHDNSEITGHCGAQRNFCCRHCTAEEDQASVVKHRDRSRTGVCSGDLQTCGLPCSQSQTIDLRDTVECQHTRHRLPRYHGGGGLHIGQA